MAHNQKRQTPESESAAAISSARPGQWKYELLIDAISSGSSHGKHDMCSAFKPKVTRRLKILPRKLDGALGSKNLQGLKESSLSESLNRVIRATYLDRLTNICNRMRSRRLVLMSVSSHLRSCSTLNGILPERP